MSSTYRLTPAADQDIAEIWQYSFENWGLEKANDYLNEIENALNNLVDNPKLGKNRDEIRQGYRSFQVGRHLIFYRLNLGKQIEAVRVLHERMDYKSHL